MEILICLIGVISVGWSLVTLAHLMRADPRFVFEFEDGVLEFEIESPGVYSIAVLGTGYVGNLSQVSTRLQTNSRAPLDVRRYIVNPTMRIEGQMATGCWYFIAEGHGNHTLSLSNLGAIKARESMSPVRRVFRKPIDSNRLRIIIHRTVRPLYQFLAILGLVIGLQMFFASFIIDF